MRYGLWHMTTAKHCGLDIMLYFFAVHDEFGDQCPGSRLHLSLCGVLVPFPATFWTPSFDYGFHHLIDVFMSEYRAVDVAFPSSAELNWSQCNTEERWLYYKFSLGSIHDIPSWFMEIRKNDVNLSVNAGGSVLSSKAKGLDPAELH